MDQPQRNPFRFDSGRQLPSQSPSSRQRPNKLAQIDIPPYPPPQLDPARRNNIRITPPVKRKPLPPSANASPAIPTFPPDQRPSPDQPTARQLPQPAKAPWSRPPTSSSPQLVIRNLDEFPRGLSPNIPQSPGFVPFHKLPADQARELLQNIDANNYSPSTINHSRFSDPPRSPSKPVKRPNHFVQRSEVTMPRNAGPGPIQILPTGGNVIANGAPPTPGKSKISSFFGWKGNGNNSPIAESSPTTISERSSPAQSPNGTSLSSFQSSVKHMPTAIDVPKANASTLFAAGYQNPPLTPAMSVQIEEMEEELREISVELASSIRREMELEDQVDRLQTEGPGALERDRRTSDYYSDSGTSSVREPEAGAGAGVDKLKRQSEQEKAQWRLDLSQKLQEERGRRRALEDHIRSLEEHIQNLESGKATVTSGPGRLKDLEVALEDNRRRLNEERKQKENYEDLLAALRVDLTQHKNERDNLRDEVVPQLRARVEGLEAEAAEFQKLTYDHTRMQQELAALKSSRGMGSIAEESSGSRRAIGLSRSNSTMRGATSLSRSNSVSNKQPPESRESLADRVKDIEEQRDALHQALKNLLERQRHQTKEHDKRVKSLEAERDRALESHSPRRRGYEKEVKDLRYEINELRQRAEDALEQKWQCEKGLGGLKMDLDRAEQETQSLRQVLVENDILVPDITIEAASPTAKNEHATSATLEKAYKELRAAHAMSISRLREIKGIDPSMIDDSKTAETMDKLLKSMSSAEADRDFAQKEADNLRAKAASLEDERNFHEGENSGLAGELRASARRVDALSTQVKRQLTSNHELRERLAGAVGKGERDQKASAARITSLQGKLKGLEDRLMSAQQQSEDSMHLHEEDVRAIKASSNPQLQRLRPSSNMSGNLPLPPNSPMSKSPRLDKTSSGVGMSMNEALRTEFLEQRVKELEAALREADKEMHEVVQKMNAAQIEAMELQAARDEAMRQTRALQNELEVENKNVGNLMGFFSRG